MRTNREVTLKKGTPPEKKKAKKKKQQINKEQILVR